MDLSSLKEEIVNLLKNIYSAIVNSQAVYFLKEKYDHLSSFYRKILQIFIGFLLLSVLLYYPVSRLYSSWQNTQQANVKTQLTQALLDLSSAEQQGRGRSYSTDSDPVRFINRRLVTLRLPKDQVKDIKKIENSPKIGKSFAFPTEVKAVEIQMSDLNLQEVVDYGQKLEKLSENIKMTAMRITENSEKDNYFNVSYTLSFFNIPKLGSSSKGGKAGPSLRGKAGSSLRGKAGSSLRGKAGSSSLKTPSLKKRKREKSLSFRPVEKIHKVKKKAPVVEKDKK